MSETEPAYIARVVVEIKRSRSVYKPDLYLRVETRVEGYTFVVVTDRVPVDRFNLKDCVVDGLAAAARRDRALGREPRGRVYYKARVIDSEWSRESRELKERVLHSLYSHI